MKVLKFLIILSALSSLFLLFKAGAEIYRYALFSNTKKADITSWEIDEENSKFFISAKYIYTIDNRSIDGKTTFYKRFLNYDAAFSYLQNLSKKNFLAWYSKKDPNMSTIERFFPVKRSIYAALASCVFIYFIFLNKKLIRDFGKF